LLENCIVMHCINRSRIYILYSIVLLQVTGYGWQGKGDGNDVWRVVAIGEETGAKIRAFRHTSHSLDFKGLPHEILGLFFGL
jgi:hypothetical protein